MLRSRQHRRSRFPTILLLLMLSSAACAGSTPAPTSVTMTSSIPASTHPTAIPATGTIVNPGTPVATPASGFRVEQIATGLQAPWALAFAPDGRIFFTERPGRVRVLIGGQLRAEPVFTGPDVAAQGEGGLLGLALAPDFAANHHLYLYYSYRDNTTMKNRVVRFMEENDALRDRQIILDNLPGGSIHNGGRILFGPDGKLYITAGDAGQSGQAQSRDTLGGKILRLNPDGSIPADNPFPNSPIYSYGHRNPQGLAWQPGTNRLYATEHGPSAHDEINLIEPGKNYGWPEMTGSQGGRVDFTGPVIESGNDTWAPSGCTFVHGDRFVGWRGSLLFAGLRSTTLWRLDLASGTSRLEPLLEDEYGRLRDVVEAPDGTLYILTSSRDGRGSPTGDDDRILRLVPR